MGVMAPAHPFAIDAEDEPESVTCAGPLARWQAAVDAGTIRADAHQERVARQLDALHRELGGYRPPRHAAGIFNFFKKDKKRPAPRGLYIHGSVGRGKSMLMDLFFAGVAVERKRRVHFHAFMAEIHDRLHRLRQDKGSVTDPLPVVAAEIADAAWLLCFDEFVVNDIADAMILGRLFQALFDEGVVVVATSNFAPKELYKDGLQRDRFEPFIAMIESRLEVMTLDGPTDYRLARLAGRPVYHVPLGTEADRAMDAAWDDLTDESPGQPAEVSVHGRRVAVPRAAHGVARFGFGDLCAKPLGASDYLALAGRYHTIMIDRVPLLGPANHNEARRFITLVDALYEAKTKLVMSAEAEPDHLYPEGRGAFEFQRTASRLSEMRSADYLARETALAAE